MKTLPEIPLRTPTIKTTAFGQSMMNTHTCPCCSYTLLRHVRPGELYWHCNHCHAEMPVIESAVHLRCDLERMLEL